MLLRLPIALYRLKLGWLLGRRFVLLNHTGRTTGITRATVLEVMRYDASSHRCYVASGWGRRSQWFRNVTANPQVSYTIGVHRRAGTAQPLPQDRAEQELRDYGRRHRRALTKLTKLMIGEAFTGSAEQYQRLAEQVPVLLLSPD
ncbi:MAG: nitroreductase family deazaflavin-dependent oxidoreductase [Pseudomonadales bacterium]